MPNLNPRTEGRNFPIVAIHGPSGSGKTRAAATASHYHRLRKIEDRKELISLKDMLWLQFDKDGLQSLQIHGMEPYFFDFSEMIPNLPVWQAAVYSRLDEAAALIKKGDLGIQYVVVDTLSSLNDYFDTYYISAAQSADLRKAYYESLQNFKLLMLKVRGLPCRQIWLCHSKSIFVDPDKIADQQRAQRSASMPTDYDIDLALTWGWKQYLRPLTNLTMGLDVDEKGNRYFITSETKTVPKWYAKNRYDDALQHREPVDLRTMFDRIETLTTLKTESKKP